MEPQAHTQGHVSGLRSEGRGHRSLCKTLSSITARGIKTKVTVVGNGTSCAADERTQQLIRVISDQGVVFQLCRPEMVKI